MLVSKVIKLTFHFVFLKLCISHVFKQQEAEDSPKLLYNEFSCERLPDVGFSGTHMLCQQLAQRMDTWRHRYFSPLIHILPALRCLHLFQPQQPWLVPRLEQHKSLESQPQTSSVSVMSHVLCYSCHSFILHILERKESRSACNHVTL